VELLVIAIFFETDESGQIRANVAILAFNDKEKVQENSGSLFGLKSFLTIYWLNLKVYKA
jgi:hypothetical protein